MKEIDSLSVFRMPSTKLLEGKIRISTEAGIIEAPLTGGELDKLKMILNPAIARLVNAVKVL